MIYPWLDVPFLTAPMLIAVVAIAHVIVSHYAVGGGVLLAVENARALRDGDAEYRNYWKKHAKFFITLTVVYGAITGVGIWLTIGVASPLATETLIRTFVFGWAIEWCFFLLELVSGFAFLYFWDKFGSRASVFTGMVYAFSAWISLVLITGITAFMLNSAGLIDDWESTGSFWNAFLNVQFLPQTVARTGCALTLSSAYVLLHASICEKNLDVREKVARKMRIPAFLGVFLLVVGVVGWAFFLSESSLRTLERAAATNIFSALFVAIVLAIIVLLIAGPIARPRETSPASALALCLLGIAGVGVGEFTREAVRKPYVVDRVVYGNQICRSDVPRLRETGLLYNGVWTRLYLDELQEKYPELSISAEKKYGWAPSLIEKLDVELEASTEPAAEPKEEGTESAPVEEATDNLTDDLTYDDPTRRFVGETAAVVQRNGSSFTPTATASNLATPNLAAPNLTSQNSNVASAQNRLAVGSPQASARNDARNLPEPDVPTRADMLAQNDLTSASDDLSGVGTDEAPARSNAAWDSAFDAGASSPSVLPIASSLVPDASSNADDNSSLVEESARMQEVKSNEELDLQINGAISRGNEDLLRVDEKDRLALGRSVFLHHCNCCHASSRGYSAVAPMIVGKSAEELKYFALRLNYSHFYMPPWAGTEVEAELLAEYLVSISPKTPADVFAKPKPKKEKKASEEPKEKEGTEEETGTEEAPEASSADLAS